MQQQLENLKESYKLSSQQVEDAVNPLEVAALFEENQVSYVLIGGHMLSYYTGTARATVDVDFIIGGSDFERASTMIDKAYNQFKQNDKIYHITYDTKKSINTDKERIDLIKDGFPLFGKIVRQYCITIRKNKHVIKIPTIEAAIALKFAASISPNRGDQNKPIDNADLMRLIISTNKFNDKVLMELGELIYTTGGKELVKTVVDIKAGAQVNL